VAMIGKASWISVEVLEGRGRGRQKRCKFSTMAYATVKSNKIKTNDLPFGSFLVTF